MTSEPNTAASDAAAGALAADPQLAAEIDAAAETVAYFEAAVRDFDPDSELAMTWPISSRLEQLEHSRAVLRGLHLRRARLAATYEQLLNETTDQEPQGETAAN